MQPLHFDDGSYRTPPDAASRLAQLSPSLYFYPHLAWVVLCGGIRAKRGRYGDDDWISDSLKIMRALETAGVQFAIDGADVLERLDGPCVIMGNHMGTLETAVLPGVIHPIRRVTFVVKASLLTYPVFGHLLQSRHPIALEQKNPRDDLKKVLSEGAERLERGVSVVVFPQGARRREFDPAAFNTIGVKLAHRAGVPIVPLALMTDAWALGRLISDVGKIDPSKKVRFSFGDPLTVSGRGVEAHQATLDFILAKLAAWKAEDALPERTAMPAVDSARTAGLPS